MSVLVTARLFTPKSTLRTAPFSVASGGVASLIDGEAVLAQYGVRDIVLDLMFNTVSALVVALLRTAYLTDVAQGMARTLST